MAFSRRPGSFFSHARRQNGSGPPFRVSRTTLNGVTFVQSGSRLASFWHPPRSRRLGRRPQSPRVGVTTGPGIRLLDSARGLAQIPPRWPAPDPEHKTARLRAIIGPARPLARNECQSIKAPNYSGGLIKVAAFCLGPSQANGRERQTIGAACADLASG